jgi:hypothetical protein
MEAGTMQRYKVIEANRAQDLETQLNSNEGDNYKLVHLVHVPTPEAPLKLIAVLLVKKALKAERPEAENEQLPF